MHRVLSGSTDLVRYQARTSGKEVVTPTQYAERGDEVVILVGRAEGKTWWRSFRTDRDIDLLIRGRWVPMVARAVVGADEPDTAGPLLDAYFARFPRAVRSLGGDTTAERVGRAVVVWCRPR
jgi:hypothetical protein